MCAHKAIPLPTRHGRIVRKRGSEPSLGVSSDGNNLETREGLFFARYVFDLPGFSRVYDTRYSRAIQDKKSEFAADILAGLSGFVMQ